MKIVHIGDLHFCKRYLDELISPSASGRSIIDTILDISENEKPDVIIQSGDVFDKPEYVNSDSVKLVRSFFRKVSGIAPVIVNRGTLSHDPNGCLNVISDYCFVADSDVDAVPSAESRVSVARRLSYGPGVSVVMFDYSGFRITCVPGISVLQMSAIGFSPVEFMSHVLSETKPHVVVLHGAMRGAETEHGVVMHDMDVEYSLDMFHESGLLCVMMGHIHKFQTFGSGMPLVYYAGSVGRFTIGESNEKYICVVDFSDDAKRINSCRKVSLPASSSMIVDIDGIDRAKELLQQDPRSQIRFEIKEQILPREIGDLISKYGPRRIRVNIEKQVGCGSFDTRSWNAKSNLELFREYCKINNKDSARYEPEFVEILGVGYESN